jgi:hypothetical protein
MVISKSISVLMSTPQGIRINNILRWLHPQALEVILGKSSWVASDNMAAFVASSEDFIDVFKQYCDKFGVNFEALKTAASYGFIPQLTYAMSKEVPNTEQYDKIVASIVVGAARTGNVSVVKWLNSKSYFSSIPCHSMTILTIRNTALSTRNKKFIDECLCRFRGYTKVLSDITDFPTLVYVSKICDVRISSFPKNLMLSGKKYFELCDTLSNKEVKDMLISCYHQGKILANIEFAKYFAKRCEQEYPKLRVPWSMMCSMDVEIIKEILKDKPRLQADCITCMFYNDMYRYGRYNSYYHNKEPDYNVVIRLLVSGFKFHRKMYRICERMTPRCHILRKTGLLYYFENRLVNML